MPRRCRLGSCCPNPILPWHLLPGLSPLRVRHANLSGLPPPFRRLFADGRVQQEPVLKQPVRRAPAPAPDADTSLRPPTDQPLKPPAVDDPRVQAALAWCQKRAIDQVVLAVPFVLPEPAIASLLAHPAVTALVLDQAPPPGLALGAMEGRLGQFQRADYTWQVPARRGARDLLYIGDCAGLTARMIRIALTRGFLNLTCWRVDDWHRRPLLLLAGYKVLSFVQSLPARGVRGADAGAQVLLGAERYLRYVETHQRRRFARLLGDATAALRIPLQQIVHARILFVCPTLCAGGAERQIVNTALGLRQQGIADLTILVSNLRGRPGNDFFYHQLVAAGIEVRELGGPASSIDAWRDAIDPAVKALLRRLARVLRGLPADLQQEITNLYLAIHALRPAIVHAWLDYSNVRAGLAAVLAGVPRLILSGRNVSPIHFDYIYQPWYRPAYQALLGSPQTVFINNSRAGAADYAAWLGLPPREIGVIRNGVDHAAITRPAQAAIAAHRHALGFPAAALVIGGMFRLSEEKRPLLWLEVVARVLAARAGTHGCLYGQGPLAEALNARIHSFPESGRVRLMAPTADARLALAACDLLLLTSAWEGTPNVLLEAQALGVPVVACGGGGTAESMADGETGLYLTESDPDPIATTVVRLLDDADRRRRLGQAGPRFVAEQFGMARMIDETIAAYAVVSTSATAKLWSAAPDS